MSTAAVQFKKAVKHEAKGRVALVGPSGSGKSYTMLEIATLLADGGLITAVDTEHGSLSKYADIFEFSVIEPESFSPDVFFASLKAAEDAGASVHCVDSLSHFWMGQGGALEFVDMAKKRSSSRDDMAGWKDFSPIERRMIDAMISSPCHVIVTMRTKTEYQEQINERTGKKQRVKIGLAPVQRQGMEYEFDLIGYMDDENTFITDKTRCPEYSQKAFTRPGAKEFVAFKEWLKGAPADRKPLTIVRPAEVPAPDTDRDNLIDAIKLELNRLAPKGDMKNAADIVKAKADAQKLSYEAFSETEWKKVINLPLEGMRAGLAFLKAKANTTAEDSLEPIWSDVYKMLADFQKEKARVGEVAYREILFQFSVAKSNQFKTPQAGIKCFLALRGLPDHVPERGELQWMA